MHKTWIQGIGILTFLFLLNSCDNTEAYYDELLDLPQLDLSSQYAYNSAYNVGDTLWMYGTFQQPKNTLTVTIGDADADIVKKEKVTTGQVTRDKIALLVTEEMGIGKRRPVVLTSGTHTIDCPEIDIRFGLSPYAFPDNDIELAQYAKAPNVAVFAQCESGTGNVFYYNDTDGSFYRVKDGETLPILTDAELKASLGESFMVANMYYVALDAAERNLYFSARLLVDGQIGFQLIRCNLETKAIVVLNDKPTKTATLYGTYKDGDAIGTFDMVFSALYPDKQGNIYALVAQNMSGATATNAGALLIGTDNKIKCLYTLNNSTNLQTPNKGNDYSVFLPDEQHLLFNNIYSGALTEYALPAMQQTREVTSSTADNAPFIGAFGDVKLPTISTPYRTISLGDEKMLTYVEGSYTVPMNIYVTDFDGSRVVAYAKSFSIGSWKPQKLVNYDADKQLYFATSNGTILKTKIVTK